MLSYLTTSPPTPIRKHAAFVAGLCLAIGLSSAASAQSRYVDALHKAFERLNPAETLERLASIESRVTGYPGCAEAADYIEQRFREIGLADVGTSAEGPFKAVVPVEKYAHMSTDGVGAATSVTLHCLWPNLVRTPKLPKDGLAGKLVYGRSGHLAAFKKLPVKGSIVLMDFDCSTRWLNAAMLGAKAIIFIEPDCTFRSDAEQ